MRNINYYLFSLFMGAISTFLFHVNQKSENNCLPPRKTYIRFFIFSTLLSLVSIYSYLYINNLVGPNYRDNLEILTGTPNF